MSASGEGLTKTYNRFHDPGETSEDIGRLRELHVEMDQAVAAAYGWDDLDLGHDFHETDQGTRYTLSPPARREVLDRLLELNHQRYAEEVAQGLHDKKNTKKKTSRKKKSADEKQTNFIDDLAATATAPGDPTQAILDALAAAGEPLPKSQLLAATGIPTNQWNGIIRRLIDSGAVTKTGERRGTRYSLVRESDT